MGRHIKAAMIGKKRGFRRLLREAQFDTSRSGSWEKQAIHVLESLLENTAEAFFLVSQSGALEKASRAAELMLGYDSPLSGGSFSSLFLAESWKSVRSQMAELTSGVRPSAECEAVMRDHQGKRFLTRLRMVAVGNNGNRPRILALIERRSNRKPGRQLIETFAHAVEKSTESVIIANRDGVIEYVNPAFERITGYTSEEAVGQTPRILKSGRHGVGFYKHLWSTILSGESFRHLLVNRRKDGHLFYEEQTITPIRSKHDRITHFVSIGRDVTSRRQQQREQEVLITFTMRLRRARKRRDLIPAILSETCHLLHMEGVALVLCKGNDDRTTFERGSGAWAKTRLLERKVLEKMSDQVIATRRPFTSADLGKDQRITQGSALKGLASVAGVPLLAQDHVVGVLWIGRHWAITEEELHLLMTLAEPAANALFRTAVHEETAQRLKRLTAVHAIEMIISSGNNLRVNLEIVLGHVMSQLEVDAASILLLNPKERTMELVCSRGFRTPEIRQRRLNVGEGYVGQAVLERRLVKLPRIAEADHVLIRNPPLGAEEFASYFAAPLIVRDRVAGVLEVFHRLPLEPASEWLGFLETVAVRAAHAVERATTVDELKVANRELLNAYETTVEAWAKTIEVRTTEKQGHTARMADATVHLARVFGIPECDLVHVRRGALLHDLGKAGISDSILQKPGPLTDTEWEIMRQHPLYASELLKGIDFLRPAVDIPFCHHERWDGRGYPRGLEGERIPAPARVFSVIDVWEALSSDRPYRAAWNEARVRDHINNLKETQFDPQVIEVFNQELPFLSDVVFGSGTSQPQGRRVESGDDRRFLAS